MYRQLKTASRQVAGAKPMARLDIGQWPSGILVALVLLAGLVAPVLTALMSILGLAALSRRPTVVGAATASVVALVLAWLNAGKDIQGDWAWYVLHYQVLVYTPLVDYLGKPFGPVSSEVSEPLYYAFARVLALSTNGNVEVLAVSLSLVIYGTLGAAVVASVSSFEKRPWTVIVATAVGLLGGLTFTLSTQLVRQEVAAALIALAIITSAKRNYLLTAAILTAAVLTHNSALIPAAGLLLATFFRGKGNNFIIRVFLNGGLFYALGRIYLATSGDAFYSGQDDGAISSAVIFLDVVIVSVFLFLISKRGLRDNQIAITILMCLPAFYGFVIGVASQPLPLLRMYFYIEILRALMIVFICTCFMQGRMRLLVGTLFLIAAVAYLALRIQQSPFVYEDSYSSLFWTPLGVFIPD